MVRALDIGMNANKNTKGKNEMKITKWFHNHEYRHLLRSPGEYQEFKGLKRHNSVLFNKRYTELKKALKKASLDPSGFSKLHTAIIAKVFKFDIAYLINVYHSERR